MTSRERTMALALGAVVTVGGGALAFNTLFLGPLQERRTKAEELEKKADEKSARRQQILADLPRLDRWKQLSLPSDVELARREYQSYLEHLTRESGISGRNVTVTAKAGDKPVEAKGATAQAAKLPVYNHLSFNVNFKSSYASLLKFLQAFYKTSLLHQIKTISVQRANNSGGQKTTDLETTLTVDAVIVAGAGKRAYLLPNMDRKLLVAEVIAGMQHGPQGIALAAWAASPTGPLGPGLLTHQDKDYRALAAKDLFHGPEAVLDSPNKPIWISPRFSKLTDITRNDRKTEGSLLDLYNGKTAIRLRDQPGFNTFAFVKDAQYKTVANATVLRIDLDNREIILRVGISSSEPSPGDEGEKIYRLSQKEREQLIQTKVVKQDEADRVYRVDPRYWQTLVKDQIVRTDEEGDGFSIEMAADKGGPVTDEFSRVEILRGKVLRNEEQGVYVSFREKYCALHVGQTVEECLNKPLRESQVQEIKSAKMAP
jgi:hypothetical protein